MMGCMQIRRERCKTVYGFLSVFVRTRWGFQNQRNLLLDERCLSLSLLFFIVCLRIQTNLFHNVILLCALLFFTLFEEYSIPQNCKSLVFILICLKSLQTNRIQNNTFSFENVKS